MSRPLRDDEVEKIVRKVVTDELKKFERRIVEKLDAILAIVEYQSDMCDGYHGR